MENEKREIFAIVNSNRTAPITTINVITRKRLLLFPYVKGDPISESYNKNFSQTDLEGRCSLKFHGSTRLVQSLLQCIRFYELVTRFYPSIYVVFVFFLFLGLSGLHSSKTNADQINPGVASVEEKHYGLTYGEWNAKWWEWAISIPADKTPMKDLTGNRCATNQSGPVWFLAGSWDLGKTIRNCTIPSNVAIFFPIYNGECSTAEDKTKTSYAQLRDCVKTGNVCSTCYMYHKSASVDGRELTNLDNYRVESQLFNITFPPNNVFNGKVGLSPVVAEGWYIMLEPLSKGTHTIHFKYSLIDTNKGEKSSATDVTYNLGVK